MRCARHDGMKRDQEDCTSPFTGKASRSVFLRRPSARPVVARVGSNRATPRVRVRAAARQSRPRSARRDDARTLTRSRSSRTTRHPGNSVNNTRIGHSPVGRRSLFCRSGHRGVARHQLDDLARIEQPVRARAQPSAHRSNGPASLSSPISQGQSPLAADVNHLRGAR